MGILAENTPLKIGIHATGCLEPGQWAMASADRIYMLGADTMYRARATLFGAANIERLEDGEWKPVEIK